jgi:hypothetical protein
MPLDHCGSFFSKPSLALIASTAAVLIVEDAKETRAVGVGCRDRDWSADAMEQSFGEARDGWVAPLVEPAPFWPRH